MSSRFGNRDHARSSLFSAYDDPRSSASTRAKSQSPSLVQGPSYAFGAYPSAPSHLRPASTTGAPYGASSFGGGPFVGEGLGDGSGRAYRSATPNTKGQYSDAVLSELESQNEDQLAGMMGRVRMLKDITTAIGTEIRDSSALADKMNDGFEGTRVRLRGTMNRMLRMAQKTGVGWRVWLLFFAAVIALFVYVWLGR